MGREPGGNPKATAGLMLHEWSENQKIVANAQAGRGLSADRLSGAATADSLRVGFLKNRDDAGAGRVGQLFGRE